MEQYVLVIVEVNEPNKAPDLKHLTIGSQGGFSTNANFVQSAINFLQSSDEFDSSTTYIHKKTIPFANRNDYTTFLNNQLDNYLNQLRSK